MLKKWFARAIMALGLGTMMLGGSSAQAGFTVADLIAGTYGAANNQSTITFDGLVFSNFSYTGNSTGTGLAPTASQVTVLPVIISAGTNDEIEFTSAGWLTSGTGSVDSKVSYHVATTDGTLITDLHLFFNGSAIVAGPPGIAHTDVVDTFANSSTVELRNLILTVYNDPTLAPFNPKLTSDYNLVTPVSSLNAQKDILLSSAGPAFTSISIIDQGYTRQGRHVPEPASFALVGLGMLATGFAAYRRRKMAQ